ncbi:MAG: hypothetical protein IJ220_05865 [Clostridia bacterium]|nr:hypothetical protein [Clostridia bacterium]
MSGFGILFLIFGICVFLVGLYMYTGHKLDILTWRAAYKNLDIDQWKNIGKWTMITSIFILLLAIVGLIFNF